MFKFVLKDNRQEKYAAVMIGGKFGAGDWMVERWNEMMN